MTVEQAKDAPSVPENIEAVACECGKPLADCQCAKGEVCECGGDPALCSSNESGNTIELALPTKS
jgi:hypothetical protein